jgi:RNase P subunit RPR2
LVQNYFEKELNCNISLLPINNSSDREIDHRYGHKNHPDYIKMYENLNQKPKDFQLIHRSLNLIKRQMCKDCVTSGIRPKHPSKPFVEGNEKPQQNFPCKGCYLAEPERYR